jgi:hypothetical protein
MRWRVRLGYPLAIALLILSRPTPRSVLIGGIVGVFGLCVRAYAAGYLCKQEVLTMTGPYAHTRNPLYLGSAILALGAAIGMRSWICASILLLYFGLFYSMVMRREEKELLARHGAAFEQYARAVPLFLPRLSGARLTGESAGSFSIAQYKKNHEWQAGFGFLLLLGALLVIWRIQWP